MTCLVNELYQTERLTIIMTEAHNGVDDNEKRKGEYRLYIIIEWRHPISCCCISKFAFQS